MIDLVDSRSTCLPGSFPVDSAREIKLGEKTVGESALLYRIPGRGSSLGAALGKYRRSGAVTVPPFLPVSNRIVHQTHTGTDQYSIIVPVALSTFSVCPPPAAPSYRAGKAGPSARHGTCMSVSSVSARAPMS